MAVRDPELERSARRFDFSALRLFVAGLAIMVVGGAIWGIGAATNDVVQAIGAMLTVLAVIPWGIALALFLAGLVSHWGSRHRPFA